MELKLSAVQENIIVKPLKFNNRQTIELSGLDRISPAIVYTVFFYKVTNESSFSLQGELDHVERAKKALSKVLIPWYPVAGRFRINEASGKLEIDCDNQGVVLVTAATDSKLEELGALHEYKTCYENLVPKLGDAADVSENPVAVVQVWHRFWEYLIFFFYFLLAITSSNSSICIYDYMKICMEQTELNDVLLITGLF